MIQITAKMIDTVTENLISIFSDIDFKQILLHVWIYDRLYVFACDTDNLDSIMRVIMNHIHPLLFEDNSFFTISYVIDICEFLSPEQKEYYIFNYV